MIRHRRKGHENTGHTNEHISSTSSNNQSAVMTRKNHRAQLRRLYEDSKFSDLIVRTLVDDGFLRNELEQFSRTGDLTRGTTTTNDVIVQVNHANVEKEAWNERRRLLNLEPIVIAIDKEDGTRESSYDEDMQQPSTSSSLTFTTSQVCPDQLNPDSFQDDFNLDPKDYGTQEDAKVISRIGELRRQGLWSSTRLPMCIEPAREKTHWDYLLEEVKWMSIDFKQERIFKRVAAKKMTQGIARWAKQVKTKEKEKVERSEKEAKQICGLIAKMVKEFWKNVDKIADFRAQEIIESKKRKALDQHLSFIVGEADKLSSMMQEGLTGVPRDEDATFDESEEDDESTLAKEEKITQPANIEQEIKELNQEADLDLDTFLATLPAGYLESLGLSSIKDTKEITEVSTPVTEQLSTQSIAATSQEESLLETPPGSIEPQITPEEAMDITASEKPCLANVDYSKLNSENSEVRQRELDHIAEEALKFQPKGYTLDSTQVKTEVPFLLRGVLREYQLVGLDWLATLYEKNLNGILADEMGLGKTIQTIALLAHLACEKAIWGPHLIVVPTSVILNWEMEFKKWCPSFKILTYFGSAKERAEKRKGWSRENSFHVCITSYKVITQDIRSFKMKAWQYFILDEAQNIKNFKSQRWQALLNIRSRRRILLTGTPLQNSLMELWSLMHFLMPIIFASHDDFKDWFSNPLTGMIEGSVEFNSDLVQRLHKVLRPFILRRLKSEVEKQLPTKTEKIIKCPLSRRQRYLYDDFLSRRTTIENLKSGSVMSVLNIVMQLRKCCNHPNLFETRPVVSPFVINPLQISFPNAIVEYERKPLISMLPQMLGSRCADILMSRISLDELLQKYANTTPAPRIPKVDGFKFHTTKEVTERARKMNEMPKITDMEVDNVPESGQNGRLHGPLQFKDHSNGRKFISLKANQVQEPKSGGVVIKLESTSNAPINEDVHVLTQHITGRSKHIQVANSMKTKVQLFKQNNIPTDMPSTSSGLAVSTSALNENNFSDELSPLEKKFKLDEFPESIASKSISEKKALRRKNFISMVQRFAHLRRIFPLFLLSEELFSAISKIYKKLPTDLPHDHHTPLTGVEKIQAKIASHLNDLIENAVRRFVLYVSKIFVNAPELFLKGNSALFYHKLHEENEIAERIFSGRNPLVEEIRVSQSLQFPEARLIEYDCGKLQMLSRLLKQLHEHKHRCLIFTQMSKMLDILQSFLAYHNYQYFRLDGATPIEQRQAMMERFNADSRIFCFILSTRSGGLGINLIGADSVIFYDSDWNPTWDQQAQDRCHRIGQTRDVVIYRLISEKTIEENILKKAMQKKRLGEMAIDEAGFTPEFFKQSSNIRDLFEGDENVSKIISSTTFEADSKDIEMAMANVEDKQDVIAASRVTAEARAELAEFDENAMSSSLKEIENPSAKYLELINRLRPIERYAVNFLENTYRPDLEEEVKEAEAQLMAKRNELIRATEIADDDGKQHAGMDLTYDRGNLEELDVHLPLELLPIWLPPSPPASDEELPFSQLETECYAEPDIYCSTYGDLWYEPFAIPEESLPRAIYELKPRKTPKKGRPPSAASKRLTPLKLNGTGGVRKRRISSLEKPTERQSLETELSTPVPGLLVSEVAGIDSNFGTIPQRITPVDVQQQKASFRETVEMITRRVAKRTGDSILQRSFFDTIRFARPGVTRHLITSPPLLRFEAMDYEGPAWTVFEDHFLFTAVTKELGYSSNLMNKSDGHVLNWDFVANFVNMKASHYRSPRQCFVRFQILNQVHDSNRNLSEVRKRQSSLDRQRYANTKERLNQESPRYLMNTIQKRYKLMGQLAAKRLPVFKRVPNENRLFCLSGRNPPQHERRLNQLGVKLAHITSPSDIRVRTQRNQLSHEDSTKGRTYKSLYTSKVLQQFPPVASSIITMPVEAKQRKSLPNILTHKTNAFVNKRSHPIPHVSETDGLVLDEARLSPIPREMYSAQPKPQPPSTWVSHVPTTTITTPNMPSYRPQIVTSVAPFSSGSPMIRRVQPGISFVNTSSQHMRPVFDAPRSSNTTEIIVHSVHTHNTPVSQQQQQQHQTSYYPNSTVQQQNVQSMPGGGMVQGSAYVAQSQQQQPQQAHSYGNEEEMNSRNWQR